MTQCQRILKHIDETGSITTMEAFEMGITRLASRVHELKKMGINLQAETVRAVNRYGEWVHFARYKRAV